ncbi:uncharacterized protein [Panulirus ornatus]|uniref:uncharacterized protein n=1 Tax=Panulirus ornatus TaxID=150431 RepID=UPI003A8C31BF
MIFGPLSRTTSPSVEDHVTLSRGPRHPQSPADLARRREEAVITALKCLASRRMVPPSTYFQSNNGLDMIFGPLSRTTSPSVEDHVTLSRGPRHPQSPADLARRREEAVITALKCLASRRMVPPSTYFQSNNGLDMVFGPLSRTTSPSVEDHVTLSRGPRHPQSPADLARRREEAVITALKCLASRRMVVFYCTCRSSSSIPTGLLLLYLQVVCFCTSRLSAAVPPGCVLLYLQDVFCSTSRLSSDVPSDCLLLYLQADCFTSSVTV